jgi:hypothetical protein
MDTRIKIIGASIMDMKSQELISNTNGPFEISVGDRSPETISIFMDYDNITMILDITKVNALKLAEELTKQAKS